MAVCNPESEAWRKAHIPTMSYHTISGHIISEPLVATLKGTLEGTRDASADCARCEGLARDIE